VPHSPSDEVSESEIFQLVVTVHFKTK
jgi:hypothetical protein